LLFFASSKKIFEKTKKATQQMEEEAKQPAEVTLVGQMGPVGLEEGWAELDAGINFLINLADQEEDARLPSELRSRLYTYTPLSFHIFLLEIAIRIAI